MYDRDLKPTGQTIERGKRVPTGLMIPIVAVYVYNDQGQYLIQKVSPKKGNFYSTTAGHVQSGERDFAQAMLREMKEEEYRKTSDNYYRKIRGTWKEAALSEEADNPYRIVLQSYADACLGRGSNVANGTEGRKSLLLSNAAYLSSWEGRMVEIPVPGSSAEKEFERSFESWLEKKKRGGKK